MCNSYFQRPEVIAAAHRMKDAAAFFSTRGWLLGTCGNLSVKLSETELLATPSGRDKSQLELEDFLVVDPANTVLSGQPARASAELGVHRAIYAAKPAGATRLASTKPTGASGLAATGSTGELCVRRREWGAE